MSNFTQPLHLKIESQAQLDSLIDTVEGTIEMHTDMLLDDIPCRVNEIHELAGLCDDILQSKLTQIRNDTNQRVNYLMNLRDIAANLRDVVDNNIC